MGDAMYSTAFFLQRTSRFAVLSSVTTQSSFEVPVLPSSPLGIFLDWNCAYTESILRNTIARRGKHLRLQKDALPAADTAYVVQLADFENIDWEPVLSGACGASSYLVRKGLSRKAQLSLQIRRYLAKHRDSILSRAVPETHVLETWNAFEEMKLDFGHGMICNFQHDRSLTQAPLRHRLDWTLAETRALFFPEDNDPNYDPANPPDLGTWILKPSVTNKGTDISLIQDWDDVLDALEETPDLREWVLQRYVANPLLVRGAHKFHLRVYILCVGAIRVFVFEDILMLIAAHKYDSEDIEDIYCHLTNTARAAEDVNFDEKLFVQLLRDLPEVLMTEYQSRYPDAKSAEEGIQKIRSQIHEIVHDLFSAYENEYSIFCPMANCFELYGLDFLVDQDLNVHFLEVNPGPDFKQTGDRLRSVITQLWEQSARIVFDGNILLPSLTFSHQEYDEKFEEYWKVMCPDFTLVYSKQWSVSQLKGGMSLK